MQYQTIIRFHNRSVHYILLGTAAFHADLSEENKERPVYVTL